MKIITYTCDLCEKEIEHDSDMIEISVVLRWPTLGHISETLKKAVGTYHFHCKCIDEEIIEWKNRRTKCKT